MRNYLLLTLIPLLLIIPGIAFGEVNLSELEITSKNTWSIDKEDFKIIVVDIDIKNNSNEKLDGYDISYAYLISGGNNYERSNGFDLDVGNKTCPSLNDIPASSTKNQILCFEVPKNFPNSSLALEIFSSSRDYCLDSSYAKCTSVSKNITSPKTISYDDYAKKFITKINNISLNFNSIELIEQPGFNILKIDFSVTNKDSMEINYYSSSIYALTPNGFSYSPTRYDLTTLGYSYDDCSNDSISINPGLTKSYSYCFEVPQGQNIFDLTIRDYGFGSCDSSFNNCKELLLPISNPKQISLEDISDSSEDSFDVSQESMNLPENGNGVLIMLNSDYPGCEESDSCLLQSTTTINVGESVTWFNFDSSIHTITSGTPTDGPDGSFDSGMIYSVQDDPQNSSYTVTFPYGGTYEYFDMLHPWIVGKVIVLENSQTSNNVNQSASPEPEPLGIASFVDQSKDPQYYIDRYNNEPKYKEWFDTNYPQYESIYQAVGFSEKTIEPEPEPEPEQLGIASFVDPEKDPRYYLVRYYTEPEYQKWFDKNFPNDTIENAVKYPNKIITDESYVNSLFDFSITPPRNWILEETPSTIGGKSVGLAAFSHPRSYDPTVEYRSSFIIHYWKEDINEIYYADLLYYFSALTQFPEQSQYKIIDESVTQLPNGVIQVRYDFNDVSILPEEIIDGELIPETNMALTNAVVVLLFPNGDTYEIIFASMPKYADSDILEFNKSIKTFHAGKTEKLSDIILNLNSQQDTTSLVETKNSITSEPKNIDPDPEPISSESVPQKTCGAGTILQDGICVVDKSQTTESKSSGGGCLIATATFDSELAPQVQKLREIRDSKLLQTESGSQFMEHFNSFYYSFSPYIADYERENPVFKEVVKAGITPMLSTLSLMDYADTESEVLGIGISLIILNTMMYVGLPVFGIMIAKKKFDKYLSF